MVQQDRNVARSRVCGRDVQPAVAIEVPEHHRTRATSKHEEIHAQLKRSISNAQKDGDIARIPVRHREVRNAIPIEIAHRNPIGVAVGGQLSGSPEGAISIAKNDRDRTELKTTAGEYQIFRTVSIQIRPDYGSRVGSATRKAHRGLKSSVSIPQQQ